MDHMKPTDPHKPADPVPPAAKPPKTPKPWEKGSAKNPFQQGNQFNQRANNFRPKNSTGVRPKH